MSVAPGASRTAASRISPLPRRAAAALAALLAAALTWANAGCGSLAQAEQPVGRADLVNDLAGRLTAAGDLTYSADYQLPDGRTASISQAQQPLRTAYTYPGGKLIMTVDATTECRAVGAAATCTRTAPPAPGDPPAAQLFAKAGGLGLVPPSTVVGLLAAAALDSDAVIEQKDTTVAGEHATCVTVRGVDNAPASDFTTCVTTAGALGSFVADVNGRPVDMTLTGFRDSVPLDAFAVPPAATVADRRNGPK